MEMLTICRICLNEDVQHVVKSLQLQNTYEKLTTIPTDMRPLAICYICLGQLKTSHRFMLKCLKAEELLAQMLDQMLANEDGVLDPLQVLDSAPVDRSAFNQLSITSVVQVVIDSGVQYSDMKDDNKEEALITYYECDVKLEDQSLQDLTETANSTVSEPDNAHSPSDPGDDVPLNNIKNNTEHDKGRVRRKQPNRLKKGAPIAKQPKIKYEVNDSTQEVVNVKLATGHVKVASTKPTKDTKIPVLNKINSKRFGKHKCKQTVQKSSLCINDDYQSNLIGDNNLKMSAPTEKPFVCDACNKSYSTKAALFRHTRTHTGVKPYVCNDCGKSFMMKCHLKYHIYTHTGQKKYNCNTCKKGFCVKSRLKVHERTHTDEKPYNCNVCGNSFAQRNTLLKHERLHTGERPYVCDFCGKRFNTNGHLKLHARTHTGEKPYGCDVCKKRFRNNGALRIHLRTHTGEKPYVCNVCKKGFGQIDHLKKHLRIHTGEKPYVCDVCKKGFTQKNNLKTHTRIHTRLERSYVGND